METWQIILIVTLGLLAVFVLMGWFGYAQVKKNETLLLKRLKDLDQYEIDRGHKILETVSTMEKNGYKKDEETHRVISQGVEKMSELNMDERSRYKNMVDMFSFILGRIHFEDKKFGKFIKEEDAIAFKQYHLGSDEKYKEYNKAAMRYNVYLTSLFTKFFLFMRREKKVTAIVF